MRLPTLVAPETIKAIDTASGEFEGYGSVFGVPDLSGDTVMAGAFAETLQEKRPGDIKLLADHDTRTPMGDWLDMREDGHGLFVRGRIDTELPEGRTLARQIEKGRKTGLSIGFNTKEFDRGEHGHRTLKKVDLWEVSVVTFPMLPAARISSAKDIASILEAHGLGADEAARLASHYRGHEAESDIVDALKRASDIFKGASK